MNFFKKLFSSQSEKKIDKGLDKSKKSFFSKIKKSIAGKSKVDASFLDELEEIFIGADVGVSTTIKIIDNLEERVAIDKYINTDDLNKILKDEITKILDVSNYDFKEVEISNEVPYVIMIVGVNGVGKTTTIGKLANKFRNAGKSVIIGAADTFRAGAIDQLEVWAKRAKVDIVKQQMGSDPASVVHDTLNSSISKKADIVLIDTAGRLHNKVNLMNELSKIKRVMSKVIPDAPHEILLVLDGSTGQNAFEQAKKFIESTSVNSLAITKLDGTAKGGVVIGICDQFQIPIKYIGIGEGIDDMKIFDSKNFINSFFN
ncbi:MAG: signal recognition particle-docking protein FtsY [Flavobacteriaceae bacterium]|nr:signal recognition particle-docking protein FtsY [Flavobacteriaceae bacterium]|tara:strand:+ start:1161 stop:2108 length:948 start_codon:yes stop_codon:yes gene_type:complete